jgi:hypothetical protein
MEPRLETTSITFQSNPAAKKVYRRNHLQSAYSVVILLMSGFRGGRTKFPRLSDPGQAAPGLPRRSLAGLAREEGSSHRGRGGGRMTATHDAGPFTNPILVHPSTRSPKATKARVVGSPKGVKASPSRLQKQFPSGAVLIATRTACPPSCWAGETLLEATKTNLLGPVLIATRTRVVTSQLFHNQYDPNF